jgi:GNAT superfamily N-acetyltransferase
VYFLACQCDDRASLFVAECGRDAFVDEIYLRESHRRQGIGTQAFAFLEQACRELGVRALRLEVEHRNAAAREFYRTAGFYDQQRHLMTRLF